MDRKSFVKYLALTAVYASIPKTGFGRTKGKKGPQRVIVIGAGISGLAAARNLQSRNFEVTIVEARDRLGGRIWTDRSLGAATDMGAGWIEEQFGNPITKVAHRNAAELKVSDYSSIEVHGTDGKLMNEDEAYALYKKAQDVYKKVTSYSEANASADRSVWSVCELILKEVEMTEQETVAFNWLVATTEVDYATTLDQYSFYLQRDGKGFSGDDVVFPEGYDQIPNAIARNLEINYEEPVTSIKTEKKKVTVTTTKQAYEAEYVVCTVPLGVLKKGSIKFDPPLPDWKQKAIQDMGMGDLMKVAVRFEETFWQKDKHYITNLSSESGAFPQFLNWAKYTDKPIVIGAVGGSFLEKIKGEEDEAIEKRVNDLFANFYSGTSKESVGSVIARWGSDPYSLGAYSYTPVNVQGNETSDALSKHVGRIYFAGEHTNKKYPATVHGAYESGLNVAEQLYKDS